MALKPWKYLNKGDIIDIIAPSSGLPFEEREGITTKAKSFIESLGYVPRIKDDLIIPGADPYSANTDDYRYEDLKEALYAEDSKAVWCIRGGYGASRLLDKLTKLEAPSTPKVLIGFSDITAIHAFLQNKWGWSSLHGEVLNRLSTNSPDAVKEQIAKVISGKLSGCEYSNMLPLNDLAKEHRTIEAEIHGGNIALVQTTIGTEWEINGKDKIIFLEDTGERGYSVDRMLTHFSQTNILKGVKAVIIGDIICTKEEDGTTELCSEAIQRFATSSPFPVLSIADIGHKLINFALPLGTDAILNLGENPKLNIELGGVVTKNVEILEREL